MARRHSHGLQRYELCLDRAAEVPRRGLNKSSTRHRPNHSDPADIDGVAGITGPRLGSRNHGIPPRLERRPSLANPKLLRLADGPWSPWQRELVLRRDSAPGYDVCDP